MKPTPIQHLQGDGLWSPLAKTDVVVEGVVTGTTAKGFFIQDPQPEGRPGEAPSSGVFVFSFDAPPPVGARVGIAGRAIDYVADEGGRPTTQIEARAVQVLDRRGPTIEPVWLTAERVGVPPEQLARDLNALEGMLVGVRAGSTFSSPSNPFGDYVVVPRSADVPRNAHGGARIDPSRPLRWLPSLRMLDYPEAPRVDVGSELLSDVTGPLNFRSAAFQIAARDVVRAGPVKIEAGRTSLIGEGRALTVLTLNGFNLDAHIERRGLVNDPDRDVDDDFGSGRFDTLAAAIAVDARGPDIVALQEIQDNDGAEITEVTSAERTLRELARAVRRGGGPEYRWAEIPPEAGADGGQPGGNIRNAFLYRPDRVELLRDTLLRIGEDSEEFDGSRKPLCARFRSLEGGRELEVINVHLASKRHQHGLFAPEYPGFDPRLGLRVAQSELVGRRLAELRKDGIDYYVTGDFNDFEFSDTLSALCEDHSRNLIADVPEALRFDYNHRGLSQALMHGVVAREQLQAGRRAEYEILHANALLGVNPGGLGEKPSDHAYVLARLQQG